MAATIPTLKQLLLGRCYVDITRKTLDELYSWCVKYEVRVDGADNHPEAFNTPLIGVYGSHFFAKDANQLFGILGIDKEEFNRAVQAAPNINKEFKVSSDLFNLLTIWGCHCTMHSKLSDKDKQNAMFYMLKMMHYKFFTGVVNHRLPHKANRDVMQLTIDELSRKFDIMRENTNTWKLVIEARARDIIDPKSIHYNTLLTFSPDVKTAKSPASIGYVISDAQTRIRTKLNLVINAYMDNSAKGNRIATTSLIGTVGEDNEKTIKELTSSYEVMIANLTNKVLNANQFIRHDYVRLISKFLPNVRVDAMRTVLMGFTSKAISQYAKHRKDEMSPDKKRIIGYSALITAVIQNTYRACILDRKVDLKDRGAILMKARDLYRSSRISDPGILLVKDSVAAFVDELKVSDREATKASLKIGFILYLILMSFDYD
jgi:hypothetical protein|nr:MAG TPA: hypothetical protein [Caudoviricetes sp.]